MKKSISEIISLKKQTKTVFYDLIMNSMGNPSANMAANPQNNATGYNTNNQPPMNGQSMPPNAGNNGGPNPPTSGNQPQEGTVEYILKQAAENGDKTAVINMLERGAPFVVDMVSSYFKITFRILMDKPMV